MCLENINYFCNGWNYIFKNVHPYAVTLKPQLVLVLA